MRISKLIKHKVETLDAYVNTDIARQHPFIEEGIVVTDNQVPLGVITSADLTRKQHNLLVDCMSVKPHVAPEEKITVVLDIIKQTGHKILPVYDAGNFVGTISQSDLLKHMQERLESQRKVLQAAAHDLKSPVNSIRQLCSVLCSTLQQPDNLEMVHTIQNICDFAQRITEDILFTEQVFEESLQQEEAVFDDLVSECVERMEAQMQQKKLMCEINLAAPVALKLDRFKITRAIGNLLSNSIKFSHASGRIVINTRANTSCVLLSVEDSGIGISKHDQKKIFDQFTSAKRTGTAGEPTTGLGLYFTRQIVEAHGGSIHLQSEVKLGSTFTISLPVEN